jgi:WD40 repeat protein
VDPQRVTVPAFDVFVSYNSKNRAEVTRLARNLAGLGVRVWFDRSCLTPGGDWQLELAEGLAGSSACAVCVGPEDLGAWTRMEASAALNRASRDNEFRVFPVLLPGVVKFRPASLPPFLATRTWVDMRSGVDTERGLEDLRCAILGIAPGADLEVKQNADVCPYRGLEAFDEEHAHLYFGRESYVQRVLEELRGGRFLAVVGPSGSGKSSLVRAGAVPRLRAGKLPYSAMWPVLILRPGAHPLAALAGRLCTLGPEFELSSTADQLAADQRTLHLVAEAALADEPGDSRLLVVVDQCEELFTLCRDADAAAMFLKALHYAAAVPGGRVTVIVTLRADFYPRLAAFRDFAQLVQAYQVLVGELTADELRQVIEEPARAVGLDIERGLVPTIVADVMREGRTLPLLEHALLETWRQRRAGTLTVQGYQDSGGVGRGLADRAEALYAGLDPACQIVARHLLLRLTQPGEGTEDTRRRIALSEVSTEPDHELVELVIERFISARLLSASADVDGDETWIEVSHEALFAGWPRFMDWIREDRTGLLVHRSLTFAAQEWQRLDRDNGALIRGQRLAEIERWYDQQPRRLNQFERAFLRASRQAEHRARGARRRRLRTVFAALVAALALISGIALVAIEQRSEAARQRDMAISRQLAASAQNALAVDPALSLALAMRAVDTADTTQAEEMLRQATHESRGLAVLRAPSGPVRSVRFFPDGKRAVSSGDDGSVQIWNIATKKIERTVPGHAGPILAVRPNPDGGQVATAGEDGDVAVVDRASGGRRIVASAGNGQRATSVAFSPDGLRLAAGTDNGQVRVVDPQTGRTLAASDLGDGLIYDVAFSPDGGRLAVASQDGSAYVLDAATGNQLLTLSGHGGAALGVGFNPSGSEIISSDEAGSVRLWGAAGGNLIADYHASNQAVYSAVFSSDGHKFVTSGQDSVVRVWAHEGIPLVTLRGHVDYALDASFNRAGDTVISGGQDGTIRLWRLGVDAAARTSITGVSLSPDGHLVAAGGADGVLRMWTTPGLDKVLEVDDHVGRSWVEFAPNGKSLVTAGESGEVIVRNVPDGKVLARFRPSPGPAWAAALDPTGSVVASGGDDGNVVLSPIGGGPPEILSGHQGGVYSVKFSPDGRSVLSGGDDGAVSLWGPDRRGQVFPDGGGAVLDVAFSPDGALSAGAYADGSVAIWDRSGSRLALLRGHRGAANAVRFSPTGTEVYTAGLDGKVMIWDIRSSRLLLDVKLHDGPATAVDVGPNGTFLVSASEEDQVLRVSACDVCGSLPAVLTEARSRAIRELTEEEERRFLS